MHRNAITHYALMLAIIVGMPSCGIKYYDVVQKEFPQAPGQLSTPPKLTFYQRTNAVYDQFQTKAIFNALWLSDPVRKTYVDMFCDKRGFDADAKKVYLQRQLEENKHWITILLLADVRDKTCATLSDKSSSWTPFIRLHEKAQTKHAPSVPVDTLQVDTQQIDGLTVQTANNLPAVDSAPAPVIAAVHTVQADTTPVQAVTKNPDTKSEHGITKLQPESIKEIELEPEYQCFFGEQVLPFKVPYCIKFALTDQQAQGLTDGSIDCIDIVIGSTYKECVLSWSTNETTPLVKDTKPDEDFYWG